ncbi:DUF885 domain-containing protein [Mucilaginibacter sp.]|jgi:uncharacterized protein (DUF885 family)|uniref:DUF885 domain-containing protein n=1 Tax=Mucilaginibacter sp. TaxID=1882438 RepID=UPI002BEFF46D|nr:DUF885 domain-containing protein [Mucilaginibacter sp.]HTI61273.1 DUF885 domain-containing protein [Mucilaginibacter sp.]
MKKALLCIFTTIIGLAASAQNQKFEPFAKKFVAGYKELRIPDLELSYVSGLQHIGTAKAVQKQVDFFRSVQMGLAAFDPKALSLSQKTDYELIKYETGLNLERLTLETEWVKDPPAKIATGGIITVPNGKAWYAYLLKRWVSMDVTPDQIYQFGLNEVERVKAHIEAVRKQTGLSEDAFYKHLDGPEFFTSDPQEVQRSFEHTKSAVYSNLHKLFSDTVVPPLKIEKGAAQQLAQTPGYYDNNTFYYNLFDKPYNKRQYDWLFIHEGVPGHHYQSSIASAAKVSDVQQLFFYIGFAEGWGAYAEELGKDLGVYKTPYAELGKWQWDIVRSVRVPLDVGLNYYGWTDEQALDFWKKNIRGQDDIAMREIARIRRWPAQVVTYKYGALQLLHWKGELMKKQGSKFSIKDFHDRVLNHGSLPLFMVKENVFRK